MLRCRSISIIHQDSSTVFAHLNSPTHILRFQPLWPQVPSNLPTKLAQGDHFRSGESKTLCRKAALKLLSRFQTVSKGITTLYPILNSKPKPFNCIFSRRDVSHEQCMSASQGKRIGCLGAINTLKQYH